MTYPRNSSKNGTQKNIIDNLIFTILDSNTEEIYNVNNNSIFYK